MNNPTYLDFYKQLDIMHTENGGKVGLFSDKEQADFHINTIRLLSSVADTSVSMIHDAGCGYGDLLKNIEINKANYIGTDSRADVVEAASKAHEGYDFMHLDLINTPAPRADIAVAIGTLAFLPKSQAVKVVTNLMNSTSRAVLVTCWGSFVAVKGSQKKEAKLMFNWLKDMMESSSNPFNRSAMFTQDKYGEATFIFFNE